MPREPYDNLKRPSNLDRSNNFYQKNEDEARYLTYIDLDKIGGYSFKRPRLSVPGTSQGFVWPMPIDGFQVNGNSEVQRHKGLGRLKVDWTQTHRDEQIISMTGQFPGKTAAQHMRRLMAVIRAKTPPDGKELYLPVLFGNHPLLVVVDDYSFTRFQGDRGSSINYSISVLRVGVSPDKEESVSLASYGTPSGVVIPSNRRSQSNKGKRNRISTTPPNHTLKRIALRYYKDGNKWIRVLNNNRENRKFIEFIKSTPSGARPFKTLPLGLKLYV